MHYRKHVKGQQASHWVDERPTCSPFSCLKALRAKNKVALHRSVNCESTDKCAEHNLFAATLALR